MVNFFRHRHSFIGNNLEKLPRSENNLTRYQTSLALDQVEQNGTVESDTSLFNIKYAESRETTAGSDLSEKNREIKKDNNKENIQIEAATVRLSFFRLSAVGFYFNYILHIISFR